MSSSDRRRVDGLLARRLQVVAGKGGVGRSIVASALALRSARRGARTLLVEVNSPDTASRYLGVRHAGDDPVEVLDKLWLCKMTPSGAMREYALMVLKFQALYHVVFENRLIRYLLRSIPSLGEFCMLGKLWYHSTEVREGAPRFDRIILDAPATGHAVTFLSVARVVASVAPKGIMQEAAEKMANLVESEDETCMHVVALPEEMPVNEGLELIHAARGRLRIPLGLAIVNRIGAPVVHDEDSEVFAALETMARTDERLGPFVEATLRRAQRLATQREHRDRFVQASGLPSVEIPDFGPAAVHRPWLDRFGEIFDAAQLAEAEPEVRLA